MFPILCIEHILKLKAMKNSFIFLGCFAGGGLLGFFHYVPDFMINTKLIDYALYGLIFIVGIGIGSDPHIFQILKSINYTYFFVPLSIILGTILGAFVVGSLLPGISIRNSLAVGCGFGYYSLSSIFITRMCGEMLGVVALLANVFREISTLLLTPFYVRYFGKLAPIASAGATSMDTTLPIIIQYSGKEFAIVSLFSGIVLTIIVPFLVTWIAS